MQKVGLSEKEAKVYLSALELGHAPVQEIARKAKVNRATTYVILEALIKKGVITQTEEASKRLFVAEAPESLRNILAQQRAAIKQREGLLAQMLPQLDSVYNLHPNKPVVRFYEGKEGLKTILRERAADAPKEVRVFFPLKHLDGLFTEEERAEHHKAREEKKIRYICIASAPQDQPNQERQDETYLVSEKDFPFDSDIAVYDDKVSISNLTGSVSGIVIQSAALAGTLKSIFDLIKSKL